MKLEEKIERFLEKEKDVKKGEYGKLWSFLLVKMSLNLSANPLDKRYWPIILGRTRSPFDIKGRLVEDGSKTCHKCNSKNVVVGTYKLEHELMMYAECGGIDDDSNYWIESKYFCVCLDCLYSSI